MLDHSLSSRLCRFYMPRCFIDLSPAKRNIALSALYILKISPDLPSTLTHPQPMRAGTVGGRQGDNGAGGARAQTTQ
jgi:hypothetical protein